MRRYTKINYLSYNLPKYIHFILGLNRIDNSVKDEKDYLLISITQQNMVKNIGKFCMLFDLYTIKHP